jgi:hypothetical protein
MVPASGLNVARCGRVSPLWREKHRSRVMPRLEAYHTVVLEVDAAAVDAFEASLRGRASVPD